MYFENIIFFKILNHRSKKYLLNEIGININSMILLLLLFCNVI